ncbi:hypothetical protein DH2020_030224 [Rehmannia glutinosa]|uniref:Uncharacterized protein n=1 Tax=Rehmannia glutinosa TaxID=99300 RepID=A0ABR0VLG1_REHGL
MANVPPVVFPSGGNPVAPSGAQQRRFPTAPFQPPRSSNPGLPFLSFDVNSAAASTSFSAAPQFPSTIGGGGGSNRNQSPPPRGCRSLRPVSLPHGVRIVSAPSRKTTFWNYPGMGNDGVDVSLRCFQYARGQKWEFGYVQVSQLDWVLYVAHCDVVCAFTVRAARWNGDHGDNWAICDLVYTCLHGISSGAG